MIAVSQNVASGLLAVPNASVGGATKDAVAIFAADTAFCKIFAEGDSAEPIERETKESSAEDQNLVTDLRDVENENPIFDAAASAGLFLQPIPQLLGIGFLAAVAEPVSHETAKPLAVPICDTSLSETESVVSATQDLGVLLQLKAGVSTQPEFLQTAPIQKKFDAAVGVIESETGIQAGHSERPANEPQSQSQLFTDDVGPQRNQNNTHNQDAAKSPFDAVDVIADLVPSDLAATPQIAQSPALEGGTIDAVVGQAFEVPIGTKIASINPNSGPKQRLRSLSATENAWRQKWIGGDQVPDKVDGSDQVGGNADAETTANPLFMPPGLEKTFQNTASTQAVSLDLAGRPGTSVELMAVPKDQVTPRQSPKMAAIVGMSNSVIGMHDEAEPFGEIQHDKGASEVIDIGRLNTAQPSIAALPTLQSSPLTTSTLPPMIAPSIVHMLKDGDAGPLQLALSPEELGRLTISIHHSGSFVHVTLNAERPETLSLMRRHASDLVADLRQSGFSGASLSFGQGNQGRPTSPSKNAFNTTETVQIQSSAPETKQQPSGPPAKGSGVDLRF